MRTESDYLDKPVLSGWLPLICVVFTVVMMVTWLSLAFGCASGNARQGTVEADFESALVDRLSASVEAAVVKLGDVSVRTGAVATGDIGSIGGGGDSVTAWIYALIVAASVLYPLVIRPVRRYVKTCVRRAGGEL